MAITQLNTKIKLRYDTLANWQDLTVEGKGGNLVLLKGEVAFCEVPAATLANNTVDANGDSTVNGVTANNMPTIIFKVGDGTHAFKDLNWASALAADIYAWAKKEHAETGDGITVTGLTNLGENHANIASGEKNKNGLALNAVIQDIYDQFNSLNGGSGSIGDQIKAALAELVNTADQQTSGTVGGDDDTKYVKGITIESDVSGVKRLKLVEGTLPSVDAPNADPTAVTPGGNTTVDVITDVSQTNGAISATKKTLSFGDAAQKTVFSGTLGVNTDSLDLPTATQVATFVKDSIADLEGATHFRGVVNTAPSASVTDGPLDTPTTYTVGTGESAETVNYVTGDIIIYNQKEYIMDASNHWVELGDESAYVLKHGSDRLITADEATKLANDVTDVTVDGASVVDDATKIAALGAMAGKDKVAYGDLESTLAADIDGKLDGVNASIATIDNDNIVTIKGGLDVDRNTTTGINTVTNTANTNDITLAKVAKTGAIEDLIQTEDFMILDGGNAEIPAQTQEP